MSGGSLRLLRTPVALLLPFVLTVVVEPGCSGGEESSPPPEATTSTIHDGSFLPAAELLALLGRERGCREPWNEPAFMNEGEPAALEALGCPGLSVRTYRHEADVDAALHASEGFCGYRVVGERWIIAVDDPERGASLADRLRAEFWEPPGVCRPRASRRGAGEPHL